MDLTSQMALRRLVSAQAALEEARRLFGRNGYATVDKHAVGMIVEDIENEVRLLKGEYEITDVVEEE